MCIHIYRSFLSITRHSRLWTVICIALGICFIVIITFARMIYMKDQVAIRHYIENSKPVCSIPDIHNGFIPQGLSYYPENDCFLITGYFARRSHSPIYICDRKSNNYKKILMNTSEGEDYSGHAGGISIYNGIAYVSGSTEGTMYGFILSSLFSAEDGMELAADVRLNLKSSTDRMRVSFSAVDDLYLYAGEFHSEPFFCTHKSHVARTHNTTQKAYLLGFVISGKNELIPSVVYSIPDRIQGACFDKGFLYLSQSKDLFSSRILTYNTDNLHTEETRLVFGTKVPMYHLDEKNAEKITQIPPMSEEILVIDDMMNILYESASNIYRFGKKANMDYIWETPVDYFR